MTDFNYSTVLTRCMLLSAMALGIGVASSILPPATSFVGALVPLIWYHTMFLRPRAAEGLPQPAINGVYYYGFLIRSVRSERRMLRSREKRYGMKMPWNAGQMRYPISQREFGHIRQRLYQRTQSPNHDPVRSLTEWLFSAAT